MMELNDDEYGLSWKIFFGLIVRINLVENEYPVVFK